MQGLCGEDAKSASAATSLPDYFETYSQQTQLWCGRRGGTSSGGGSGCRCSFGLEKCMGEHLKRGESRNCFPRDKVAGMEPALAHDVSDSIYRGPESYRQPSVIINHSDGSRIVLSPGLSSVVGRRG